MDLSDYIRYEEEILQESLQNNQDILANVEDLIMLLSDVVISKDKRAASFYLLSSQVRNDLVLCLLSSLRRHETQSKLMKRQAIEKACLATYSLVEPDIDKFLGQDENGAKPIQKTLDRSFKYVNKHFPSHSHQLKWFKDMINSFYAHGNMFNSLRKEERFGFFDKQDALIQRAFIWKIGYLASVIFDLWYHAVDQCAFAIKNVQSYQRFVKAVVISQKYREGFANHERFAKYKLLS
ncbi:hypothetical protein G3578_04915 [Brevibacillus sp. SYP-B805]|uniref:hypothetical protein n=1 Tax=Brevibacillus sp. SYP-B805 TaxID=1578199 RepID=UPI0013EBE789|nr:hypothetical protein [Brevibacillus sp. SYP-B805]NGQ94520.1 hypothetical protein [Brevibacillus sp. SYP-B805]